MPGLSKSVKYQKTILPEMRHRNRRIIRTAGSGKVIRRRPGIYFGIRKMQRVIERNGPAAKTQLSDGAEPA